MEIRLRRDTSGLWLSGSLTIVFFIVSLNTVLAGAQDRLHTADALLYAKSQERQLVLRTVLGENYSLCDGAFIDESNQRGLRIDLKKSTITLTDFFLVYEDDNWRLRGSKSYSVVIDRSVCRRLSWLYNLAVSTSSPQNPNFVLSETRPCSFVFGNMIADDNHGSDSLVALSQKVCDAIVSNNPAAINALKGSIEHLADDYKKFARLDVESIDDVYYIGVGSMMGPFSVRVSYYPYTFSAIEEKTVEEFARYLLEKSAQPFHCSITVTKDSEWFKASGSEPFMQIGIKRKDFSLEKLKRLSQGWLW